MAIGLPLPKQLLVHSHWTVGKKKMSKSVGNVVDPFETMKTFGTDAARYFLARVGGRFKYDVGAFLPTTHCDAALIRSPSPVTVDWTNTQFVKHSAELMSLVGNFYSRITAKKIEQLLHSSPLPTVIELQEAIKDGKEVQGSEILLRLGGVRQRVQGHMQNLVVADAIQEIIDILALVSLGGIIPSQFCSWLTVVLQPTG
jgi:methionyl-tRNA synthetase